LVYSIQKRAVIAQSVYLWAMGWMIRILGFDSQWGLGIFLFTITSRMVLGLTQPPIQWIPEALSLGVKQPGCEAHHSPPSSTEVKECMELYLYSHNTLSWHVAWLKHRDFTFYLYSIQNISEVSSTILMRDRYCFDF
jgi:hypothetical protein